MVSVIWTFSMRESVIREEDNKKIIQGINILGIM